MINDVEFFRKQTLQLVESMDSAGMRPDTLLQILRTRGFPQLTAEVLDVQLNKLAGDGYVERHTGILGGRARWRITETGRANMEALGLL